MRRTNSGELSSQANFDAARASDGTTPTSTPERLIRLTAVLAAVGLGRTAVLDRVKAGTFPQPVKIGRATCWREAEVSQWIRERVREHRGA